MVSAATGVAFVEVPGEGYVSHARFFVIEKACAGVNFMLAAFGLVVLARVSRVPTAGAGAALIAASLGISYLTAILVNATRIAIALWLAAHPAAFSMSAAQVHRIEGIVVYFGALVLLHELVQRAGRSSMEQGAC